MNGGERILAVALRRQWKRYRKALQRCQNRFSKKKVHAARVECRRFLAQIELLEAFRPSRHLKKAERILRRQLDVLDPVRDAQVHLDLLQDHRHDFSNIKPLWKNLRQREKRCRQKAARRFAKLPRGQLKKMVHLLLPQLQRRAPDPIAIFHAVDAAFARVLLRRERMQADHVDTIHRTRVAFKKFRYMVEALHPFLPESRTHHLKAMQRFQSLLGSLQDTDVLLSRIVKFMRQHPRHALPCAPLRDWLKQRRVKQVESCLAGARIIDTFWKRQLPHLHQNA